MTDPYVNGNGDQEQIVFGRSKAATYGDPVRVTRHQGLWRLVGVWAKWIPPTEETDGEHVWFAEVVGPYFPKDPSKNRELSRVFAVTALKWADKATKADVSMSPAASAISQQAKQRKR